MSHSLTTRLPFALPLLLLACFAVPALALEPFAADYRASYMGINANARMSLAEEDGRWNYRLELTGAGVRLIQSTLFAVQTRAGNELWQPLAGEEIRRGESGLGALLVKNRSIQAAWDWEKLEARWTGDTSPERAGPVPIQPGDVDAMLLNLALVRDVQARKPLRYRLVESGRAKEQRFQRAGSEEISLNGETRRALKVIREDGSRRITAWVVDGLPVPARLLQQRNGRDEIDLRLIGMR